MLPMSDSTTRRRYPSDLPDDRWQTVASLIPQSKKLGRPRARALREIVDAINYHWETGCAWRMLPHDFPPWGTVYAYFRKWRRMGVLKPVRDKLLRPTPRMRKPTRHNPRPADRDFQNPDVAPAS